MGIQKRIELEATIVRVQPVETDDALDLETEDEWRENLTDWHLIQPQQQVQLEDLVARAVARRVAALEVLANFAASEEAVVPRIQSIDCEA